MQKNKIVMTKKKRTTLIMALLIIFVILVVIALFIAKGNGKEKNMNGLENEVTDTIESGIKVETSYGDLFVSDEWYDYFEYEIIDEEAYRVDFKAVYEESAVVIFSLVFADDFENGTLLGKIANDEKDTNVYVIMEELEIPENLPNEKHDAFYGMQEEINSIIDQLKQMDKFTAVE